MAGFLKNVCTMFFMFAVVGAISVSAQGITDQMQIQQHISNIGNAVMKLLNPFDVTREAVDVAEKMVVGMQTPESRVIANGETNKDEEGYGESQFSAGCTFDCRGDGWDVESEDTFQNEVMNLQLLADDLSGVVPHDIDWVLPSGASAKAAMALPVGLVAAKIAKPFAWKLGLAAKVAFLKLVFLKKLLLVKAKVGALKLAKVAFLSFPLLIVPLIKGIGIFKLISIALIAGMKTLDCIFHSFGSCDGVLMPEESLMLQILPWFTQHLEVNHDSAAIFRIPSEFLGTFINHEEFAGDFMRNLMPFSTDGLAGDFMRNVQQFSPDSFAELLRNVPQDHIADIADQLRNANNGGDGGYGNGGYGNGGYNYGGSAYNGNGENGNNGNGGNSHNGNGGNVANGDSPNLRRLGESGGAPGATEASSQIQTILQGFFKDLMGDFSPVMQTYQDVRREYSDFTGLARMENPELIARSLRQELNARMPIPKETMKVISSKPYEMENMVGYRFASETMSVKAIDDAFRELAMSVQSNAKIQ